MLASVSSSIFRMHSSSESDIFDETSLYIECLSSSSFTEFLRIRALTIELTWSLICSLAARSALNKAAYFFSLIAWSKT